MLIDEPKSEVAMAEREPNRFRDYYVIVSERDNGEGTWLRLSWRADATDTDGKSLLCDLENWQ